MRNDTIILEMSNNSVKEKHLHKPRNQVYHSTDLLKYHELSKILFEHENDSSIHLTDRIIKLFVSHK